MLFAPTFKIPVLVIALLGFALLTQGAAASPRLLVDAASHEVVFAEDASASWHPASLTKLMTAYLAFKALRNGDLSNTSVVSISAHAAAVQPSRLGVPVGSGIRIEDALAIMLTRSMNDVATAIAETVSGTEEAFVQRMNEEAINLGMNGTRFTNASGLPSRSQVSTAEDLAILAIRILTDFPEKRWMFSIPELSVANKTLRNTNGLIGRYRGSDGMKTGYVCGSGFNVVSTATRGGRQLVAIVLGAPNAKSREKAAASLLDFGFQSKAHGTPLISNARSPGPAADMTQYQCGKSFHGFKSTLPGSEAVATKTPIAADPPDTKPPGKPSPRVRRF